MQVQTFISKVIADGRITIPKNLREKYNINNGDHVEVQIMRKINKNPTETS